MERNGEFVWALDNSSIIRGPHIFHGVRRQIRRFAHAGLAKYDSYHINLKVSLDFQPITKYTVSRDSEVSLYGIPARLVAWALSFFISNAFIFPGKLLTEPTFVVRTDFSFYIHRLWISRIRIRRHFFGTMQPVFVMRCLTIIIIVLILFAYNQCWMLRF